MRRVAVLVLALLAGCRREGEAARPGTFTPAPRYSAELDATYDGCRGPLAAFDAAVVLTSGDAGAAALELVLTPRDVLGLSELRMTPEVARAPVTTRCRWTGAGQVVAGRWRVSLARVDGEEVLCGDRAAPLGLDCGPQVLRIVGASGAHEAAVLSCRIVSPREPALWMFPGGLVVLGERPVKLRVEAGTFSVDAWSGAPR